MRKVAATNNEYGGIYINSLGTQGLVLEDIVACSNGDAFGDIIPSSGLFAKYSGIVACDKCDDIDYANKVTCGMCYRVL